MRLAIMQPYFFPYIGYIQMLAAVDRFVIYDDVNFIKNGWINRNRILVQGKPAYFTLTLKGASPFKLINEVEVNTHPAGLKKLKRSLEINYAKAPFFRPVMEQVEQVFAKGGNRVSDWALNSILMVKEYLGLQTEIIPTSTIYENQELERFERVVDICKRNESATYINPIGGQELYQKEAFQEQGIELYFIKSGNVVYPQYPKYEFVPYLSILDVLMFNSPEQTHEHLKNFELI